MCVCVCVCLLLRPDLRHAPVCVADLHLNIDRLWCRPNWGQGRRAGWDKVDVQAILQAVLLSGDACLSRPRTHAGSWREHVAEVNVAQLQANTDGQGTEACWRSERVT